MPILYEFSTDSVRSWDKPVPDTKGSWKLPKPLVTHPRLPHCLRKLDIDKNANIRVKSSQTATSSNDQVDSVISTWSNTTLYGAIDDCLILRPADMDFQAGEYKRDLIANPNSPASTQINFERPFVTPPKVIVFFNYIDLDQSSGWRLKTSATEITEGGFKLNIETWSNTTLYAAQVGWIAYPEDRTHIFSTSFNTNDVRQWDKPQLQQQKDFSFDKVEFWKNPDVFVALNYLDIDNKANLRINAYVDNVSKTGLTFHIDSWADTTLYAAGASIIAFN